jgi:hypothetical protein
MFIQKELWKIALPLVSLILLFLIILPVHAILYNQDGFLLHGSPEEGWIFITPEVDYFAMWLGEDLGSIWIDKQTGDSECLTTTLPSSACPTATQNGTGSILLNEEVRNSIS